MSKFNCAKVLSTCFSKFHGFTLFQPPILEWNHEAQTFKTKGRNSFGNTFSLGKIVVVNGLITCLTSIFTLYHQSRFSFFNVIFAWILLLIGNFDACYAWSLYWNCEDVVLAFQRMKHLAIESSEEGVCEKGNTWKVISNLMKLIVVEMATWNVFLPIFFVVQNVDPVYNIVDYYQLSMYLSFWGKVLLGAFRFLVLEIFFIELARVYGFFVAIIFYWFEMQAKCIENMRNLGKSFQLKFFRTYEQYQVACQTLSSIFSNWIFLMLSTLFFLSVSCAAISIRFMSVLPLSVYYFVLCVGVIDLASIYMVFPFLTDPLEQTERILLDQKRFATSSYSRKRLKAMRPIPVKLGTAFWIRKRTKSEFYSAIVESTMNGILI